MKSIVSLDSQVETQVHRLAAVFTNHLTDLSISVIKTPSNSFMVCFLVSIKTDKDDKAIASGHGWTAEMAVNNVMRRLKITRVQEYITTKAFEAFIEHKDQQVAA